ncbi:proton-conducting transporter transmembrane domain-containing protein [Rhodovibrio sodomensis]|nr:proton-conducting transporter membrane subunit [Rhodovibrio sodomensis]
MPVFVTALVWIACAFALAGVTLGLRGAPLELAGLRIDALSLTLAVAATLVSGIVHLFALRYMAGERGQARFFGRLGLLTLVVLLLLAADHVVLFAAAWIAMGLLLASLIGHIRDWPQARAAAGRARALFLLGGAALSLGLVVLARAAGTGSIHGILGNAGAIPAGTLWFAVACFALAAMIQCGLVPFHSWLMASMTAPTPVSAFMHAGLVNAGGILLARFAPVFDALPTAMTLVFAIGAVSVLLAALAQLVQSDVKRGLAASTVAQMGFMLVQCGLGFFAAAMAHLALHGLYKASLFLGAGSAVVTPLKCRAPRVSTGAAGVAAVAAGGAGGGAFALVSGKLDYGLFTTGAVLVIFAGVAAAQAALAFARTASAPALAATPPVLAGVGALYGLLVVGAEALLAPVPGLSQPQPLTAVHLLALLAILGAWGAVAAGLHTRSRWLYARLLTWSQPPAATVSDRKSLNAGSVTHA